MENLLVNGLKELFRSSSYRSSSHLVVHKASVKLLHLSWFTATLLLLPMYSNPIQFFPFQLFFSRLFLVYLCVFSPLGPMSKQSSHHCPYPLSMCPIIRHLRFITSLLNGFISALAGSSCVLTLSCHFMPSMRLKHLFWNTSISLLSALFTFHVLQLYNSTGTTKVLIKDF